MSCGALFLSRGIPARKRASGGDDNSHIAGGIGITWDKLALTPAVGAPIHLGIPGSSECEKAGYRYMPSRSWEAVEVRHRGRIPDGISAGSSVCSGG
nr:outer membrane protein 1 [Anaplasma centrale str. Israel]AOF42909.1 major surface protein 2 [Anaplasma centrale]